MVVTIEDVNILAKLREEYKKLPDGSQLHLYKHKNVLRPRGHMQKESIAEYLLQKLLDVYESWTDKRYGDNPDPATLIKLLQDNMKEETDGAWREFIKQINTDAPTDII